MRPIEILLIEDNPADVKLTQYAFKSSKFKYNLHVAIDGEEALDFLFKRDIFKEAPKPDVILLDLNLPKIEGHEILKMIKETDDLKAIPVCVMSGSQAERDIAASYDLQANCYMLKPVDLDKIITIIASVED
jgi:CheY-like chemotaxis protein